MKSYMNVDALLLLTLNCCCCCFLLMFNMETTFYFVWQQNSIFFSSLTNKFLWDMHVDFCVVQATILLKFIFWKWELLFSFENYWKDFQFYIKACKQNSKQNTLILSGPFFDYKVWITKKKTQFFFHHRLWWH